MQAFVIINYIGMISAGCECKDLFDKGFIWSPSNCVCECDKMSDWRIKNENCM